MIEIYNSQALKMRKVLRENFQVLLDIDTCKNVIARINDCEDWGYLEEKTRSEQ